MDYFRIDHDRENNPNKSQVIEEIEEELADTKEWVLQKQVMEELKTIPLSRKLNRLQELAYFLGRYDGENIKRRDIL